MLSLFLFPFVHYLFEFILKIKPFKSSININHPLCISFGIIFFFGFLVWLAMYPGMYGYDAVNQVKSLLNGAINNHFSVIYSYILGFFIKTSMYFNWSHETAIALYSMTQLILMSFGSSIICTYIYNSTKNIRIYIISLFIYTMLLPYKLLAISTCQDVLFGLCFSMIFLLLLHMIIKNEYKNYSVILLILLLCLFRNNGVYCVLFTLFTSVCLFKRVNKKIIIILFLPMVLYYIITGPVYSIFNIVKVQNNSIKEMSSIPGQQLTLAYIKNRNDFSDKDIDTLQMYYGDLDELTSKYFPSISDETKSRLKTELVRKNYKDYIYFWLRIGFKSPRAYMEAFLLNNLSLWYPFKIFPDERMYHPLIEYRSLSYQYNCHDTEYTIINKPILKSYDNYIKDYITNYKWKNIPIINIFYSPGFYFILTLLVLFIILYKKQYIYLIPLSLIVGLYITLFLAPVILYRYIFPVVCCTPLYSLLLLNKKH